MIPEFPEFKGLELSDKKEIEEVTRRFPPYSDFNFTSMWSWDIKGEMRISKLNNNIVARFTDYMTGEPFYSFIGDSDVNDTVQKLLDFSKEQGIEVKLKLVPEESVKDLDKERFRVVEDRDHFDYIYEIDFLLKMENNSFRSRRRNINFFEKTYSHKINKHDKIEGVLKQDLLDLFTRWVEEKKGDLSDDYFQNEFIAMSRFLNASDSINFFILSIYSEDKLIAVSVTENVNGKYQVGHFQKSMNESFSGLGAFLIHENSRLLSEKGVQLFNWEQDMGINGLRIWKESYKPCYFLKKYEVLLI